MLLETVNTKICTSLNVVLGTFKQPLNTKKKYENQSFLRDVRRNFEVIRSLSQKE